jgi:hypothetical protein
MPSEELWSDLDGIERLVTLFAASGGRDIFGKTMHRLHADNKLIAFGESALSCLLRLPDDCSRPSIGEYCIGADPRELLLAMRIGISEGKIDPIAYGILEDIIKEQVPRTVGELAVNGKDLSSLGIKGAEIGSTMRSMLRAVAREEVKNEKHELLRYMGITQED